MQVYLFISLMSLKTIYWKIHLRGIPFFYSPNSTLHLYGGAAFERVIYEFRCAAYSIECPPVSREKVANILLAHAGRGGARGITEAAAKIARFAARSWLAPLFDTVCDRLGFVLGNLFDLALERNRSNDSEYGSKTANMDDCVGFHAALRCAYSRFIKDLSKQCKQLIRHHLDSVTSPFLQLDVLLVFLDV
ncbi:Dynamin-related protein 5A [Arachis hypogaea]|nr:Dynamin-related protein 5A [Arachis hypogaea]